MNIPSVILIASFFLYLFICHKPRLLLLVTIVQIPFSFPSNLFCKKKKKTYWNLLYLSIRPHYLLDYLYSSSSSSLLLLLLGLLLLLLYLLLLSLLRLLILNLYYLSLGLLLMLRTSGSLKIP